MANNPGRLVCLCNRVTAKEILDVLRSGATSTDEVQQFTLAGTGCTRCVREIDALVDYYKATSRKDPQLRIDFKY